MARKRKPERRRPKGQGTVYAIRNRRKEIVGYYAEITIDGVTVRERAATEQAAEAELEKLREMKRKRIDVGSGAQTLATWLDTWLELLEREGRLKLTTLADYRRWAETYIIPRIGDRRLSSLTPDDVQGFVFAVRDDIAAYYAAKGRAFSGAATAGSCAVVLKMALDMAAERRLIIESPYRRIVIPKAKVRKVEPPTVEQMRVFLASVRDDTFEALWYVYALLGLRLGEGIGLRWQDYDAGAQTLYVRQNIQRVNEVLHIGTPKSEAGERLLPVPDVLAHRLEAQRALQLSWKIANLERWQDTGLIFTGTDGSIVRPRYIQLRWRAAWERAQLPAHHVTHDMRKFVATTLDELGATETIKAGILGHTKETITQDYITARVRAMRRLIDELAALVMGA